MQGFCKILAKIAIYLNHGWEGKLLLRIEMIGKDKK